MSLKHKHGDTYANMSMNTSAGLVQLDSKGCVQNIDDVNGEALLAGGHFIDTDLEPEEYIPPVEQETVNGKTNGRHPVGTHTLSDDEGNSEMYTSPQADTAGSLVDWESDKDEDDDEWEDVTEAKTDTVLAADEDDDWEDVPDSPPAQVATAKKKGKKKKKKTNGKIAKSIKKAGKEKKSAKASSKKKKRSSKKKTVRRRASTR